MEISPITTVVLLVSLVASSNLMIISCHGSSFNHDNNQVYIVYMGGHLNAEISTSSLLTNILEEATGSSGSDSLLYIYKRSFNGFAAKLSNAEMNKLAGMEGVVSIFPSERKQLHTTRSWDFLGFPQKVKRSNTESDIIVGVFDTGIWPESESFTDEGFGPPPTKWKGTCDSSANFTCNNKIIGAKYYRSNVSVSENDVKSPRDTNGHGSHTASTAAGNFVAEASLAGLGQGTARGGVPSARIAVYKVCWFDGCYDADILAAFDDAIADGVDIISTSLGPDYANEYFNDSIFIGSFHAMKHGILTSTSAGNSGPDPASVTNFAPWTISVAASTIDRKFVTGVMLGNGVSYTGVSINTINMGHNMYPVIYGGDAPNITGGSNSSFSRYCLSNSLNKRLVKGKIVLCDYINDLEDVVAAGGIGVIMQDDYFNDSALNFPLPASHLGLGDGQQVYDYIRKTRRPTATIYKSNQLKDELAPYIVSFSSRGPNPRTNDILSPDVAAPGVDILAAWSQGSTVTGQIGDKRVVPYNIDSGTSMACPHVTGAAAYVKSMHPTWSPAAIKSALMTTATPLKSSINTDAEFAYGSGQINPLKAIDPGLIYDTSATDYIKFLCGQGYTNKQLEVLTGDKNTCSKVKKFVVWDLNYPSFTLSTKSNKTMVARVFHRTVTNVGQGMSVYNYKAIMEAPNGLKIKVIPNVLKFKSVGEKQSFMVKVSALMDGDDAIVSGALIWDDGDHRVRSPIVAYVLPKKK